MRQSVFRHMPGSVFQGATHMKRVENFLYAILAAGIAALFLAGGCKTPPPTQQSVAAKPEEAAYQRSVPTARRTAADSSLATVKIVSDAEDFALEFNPTRTAYTVSIPVAVRNITITATAKNPDAVVRYAPNQTIHLQPSTGTRAWITVTVPGSGSGKRYVLDITQPIANVNLAELQLITNRGTDVSPALLPNQTSYTVGVPHRVTGVSVRAKTQDVEATVTYAPRTLSFSNSETETIRVTVTGSDNATKKTYTVEVQREPQKELYVKAGGDDRNGGASVGAAVRTLAQAVSLASKSPGTDVVVIGTLDAKSEAGNPYADDRGSVFFLNNTGPDEIFIRGASGASARLTAQSTGKRVIKVAGNSNIAFENILISGGSVSNADGAGLYVDRRATVFFGRGASVRDNQIVGGESRNKRGAGVFVAPKGTFAVGDGGAVSNNFGVGVYADKGGTVAMSGGVISANRERGVYLSEGSSLIMSSGSVADNWVQGAGAGVYVAGGMFTMTGGRISGNISTGDSGGGVYVASGTFTLTGGAVTQNRAGREGGGAYIETGVLNMKRGRIAENQAGTGGGGIYFRRASGTMTGGEITGNSASSDGGGVYLSEKSTFELGERAAITGNKAFFSSGGVYVQSGTFIMQNGTVSGNKASDGGGIYVRDVFTMNGGVIRENEALSGGGIFLQAAVSALSRKPDKNTGICTMNGGIIAENTARSGGGAYLGTGASFIYTDGTIRRNTAAIGAAVFVGEGSFTVSEKAVVDVGNSAYLNADKTVVMRGTLRTQLAANIIENGISSGEAIH